MRPMYHKDPMTPYCKAALKNQLTPFSWTKKARSPDSFWPISNKKQPQWRGEKNEAKGAELPNWETQHYLALLLLLRTSSRRVGKKEGRKKNGRKKKSLGGRMRPHAPQRSNDDILPSSLVTRALWIWRVWKNCDSIDLHSQKWTPTVSNMLILWVWKKWKIIFHHIQHKDPMMTYCQAAS